MDEKIYWVNTRDVKSMNGGDPRDRDFYNSLVMNPKTDEEMKETPVYKWYIKQMENGVDSRLLFHVKNEEDVLNRIKFMFDLNSKIKENKGILPEYAIPIMVDEFGRMYAFDGNHRLICAYWNNIEKIPVYVYTRNEKWIKFVDWVKKIYGELQIYNPIYHLDFEDIPMIRNSEERFQKIVKSVSEKSEYQRNFSSQIGNYTTNQFNEVLYYDKRNVVRAKGLDLGCHFGFFSHKFAKLGANMTGVDADIHCIKSAKLLNKTYGVSVDFYLKNIKEVFTIPELEKEEFDFTLLLSVAYYVKNESQEKYIKLLKDISERSKILFIDERLPEMTKENIIEDVLKNTQYKNYESLGSCGRDKREMFVFFK